MRGVAFAHAQIKCLIKRLVAISATFFCIDIIRHGSSKTWPFKYYKPLFYTLSITTFHMVSLLGVVDHWYWLIIRENIKFHYRVSSTRHCFHHLIGRFSISILNFDFQFYFIAFNYDNPHVLKCHTHYTQIFVDVYDLYKNDLAIGTLEEVTVACCREILFSSFVTVSGHFFHCFLSVGI